MEIALNVVDESSITSQAPRAGGPIRPFKILLADPPAKEDDYDKAYPNLGILQLISYLREKTPLTDDEILLLDPFHSLDEHVRVVQEHRPQVYGLSFAYAW